MMNPTHLTLRKSFTAIGNQTRLGVSSVAEKIYAAPGIVGDQPRPIFNIQRPFWILDYFFISEFYFSLEHRFDS